MGNDWDMAADDAGEATDAVEIAYDPDTCEEACEHVFALVTMCQAMEDELGADYANETRRQLGELLMTLRVDGRGRATWRDLPAGAPELRRALRQPTTAPLPTWTHGPRSAPSAPQ